MKPRFTLRDLFWLMLLIAMGFGWFIEARRPKLNEHHRYKLWGFDLAAERLKAEVGIEMRADWDGVYLKNRDGTSDHYTMTRDSRLNNR